MKTTVNISDALFEEARRVAHDNHTTMKALIEEGLRWALARRKRRVPFKLRDASFKGKGLHREFSEASWEALRDAAYKGRGA